LYDENNKQCIFYKHQLKISSDYIKHCNKCKIQLLQISRIIFNNYIFIIKYIINSQKLFIFRLLQLLSKSEEHILLRNFNLHHLIWDESQCFIRHNMMNELLCIVNEADLQLLILSDIITWEARNQSFTVNLIFSSVSLKQKMISYYININLKNDSDHHSIFT